MLSLNYHAFTWVMVHLLERLGYADVRPIGRTGFFGRNSHGGHDIEAKLPFALGERRVIVRVKQYDQQMVFRRAVDELRGACLRVGASEGILLTTGPIAPSLDRNGGARMGVNPAPAIAPVTLVDGEELLDLMVAQGIGVRHVRAAFSGDNLLRETDADYFQEMERAHPGSTVPSGAEAKPRPTQNRFLLTVEVQPLRKHGRDKADTQITRLLV